VKSGMTVVKKLMAAYCAMLVLMLGLAYSTLSSVGSLGAELYTSTTATARKADLIGQIGLGIANMSRAQRGLVLYSLMKDSAKADEVVRPFMTAADNIDRALTELKPMLVTVRGKQAVDRISMDLSAWRPLLTGLRRFCAEQRFDSELKATIDKMVAYGVDASKANDELAQAQRDLFAASAIRAAEETSRSRWIAIVLVVLCLAIGGAVIYIVRQIGKALRHIAAEMADGAEQVASASGQVSSSSQALAQGASEQAASLEETSASTEEIHSMTQKNATNSKSAAEFMSEAATRIEQANHVVDEMVASMKEINASSDKVAKIIKVIDEIAFQTNILALNAAVEAARAGEAGMGFAVVADEVRNLAQRCAQAAKDTAALIEESIAKTNDGKTKLDQVTAAIHATTESANAVKTLVDEVNHGSQEQARGIEQIAKAVTQMEQVTQKTAASAEESASASEELSAQSQTMREVAGQLQGMVGGGEVAPDGHVGKTAARYDAAPRTVATSNLKGAGGRGANKLVAAGKPDKSAIPLDEDFKEF